jgi:hypothetical protein
MTQELQIYTFGPAMMLSTSLDERPQKEHLILSFLRVLMETGSSEIVELNERYKNAASP